MIKSRQQYIAEFDEKFDYRTNQDRQMILVDSDKVKSHLISTLTDLVDSLEKDVEGKILEAKAACIEFGLEEPQDEIEIYGEVLTLLKEYKDKLN